MRDHDDTSPASQLLSNPLAIADQIGSVKSEHKLPPIHLWDPPFCGDIDMEIRRNGEWYYQGSRIQRPALVKLFSSVMRREADDAYYLVTPVEKVRIRVEDAPLFCISVNVLASATDKYIEFTTLTGDVVVASPEHPIRVEHTDEGPVPYVHVRDRLSALISRPVYYELVALGREVNVGNQRALVISSAGADFCLGQF